MLQIKPIPVNNNEATAVRFFRAASTTDLNTIMSQGLHQPNESASFLDYLEGTNFLGLGTTNSPSFHATYTRRSDHEELTIAPNFTDRWMRNLADQQGYSIAIFLNITEQNFHYFQNKIGEKPLAQSSEVPRIWRENFDDLKGEDAIIRTDLIPTADLVALGVDVQNKLTHDLTVGVFN